MVLTASVAWCETILQLVGTSLFTPAVLSSLIGLLSSFGIWARVLAQREAEHVADQ